MTSLKLFRTPWLAFLCSGAALTSVHLLLIPPVETKLELPAIFAEPISLIDWELQSQDPVKEAAENQPELVGGTVHRYTRDNATVEIQTRYLTKMDASVRNLLLKYDLASPTVEFSETTRQNESGYYSVFHLSKTAHLTSCINPRGGSTVTAAQFTQNRYANDLRVERLLPIMLGKQTVQDSRCIWVYMSMPLGDRPPDLAQQQLETLWQTWQPWWSDHFPES